MSHYYKKLYDLFDSNTQNTNDKYMRLPLKLQTTHPVTTAKTTTPWDNVPNHNVERLKSMRSKPFATKTKNQKEHLYMRKSSHLQVIRMDFRRVKADSTRPKSEPKCWTDGQVMTERFGSSGGSYVEERRVRRLTVQEFVDQLRQYKQSGFVSSSQPLPDSLKRSIYSQPGDAQKKAKRRYGSDRTLQSTKWSKDNFERTSSNNTTYGTPKKFSRENNMEAEPHINLSVQSKYNVTRVKEAVSSGQRCKVQRPVSSPAKMINQQEEKRISDLTLTSLSDESILRTLKQISSYTSTNKITRKCSKDRRLNVAKKEVHPPTSESDNENTMTRTRKMKERKQERREQISNKNDLQKAQENKKERAMQKRRERNCKTTQKVTKTEKASKIYEAALHACKECYNKGQKYGKQHHKKYLPIERERAERMEEYSEKRLAVKNCYERLKFFSVLNDYRRYVALSFYNKQLLKQGLKGTRKSGQKKEGNNKTADDFHDHMKSADESFRKWQERAQWHEVVSHNLIHEAEDLYRRKHLPVTKEETETEKQKQYWRNKMQELIPDFCSNIKEAT